MSPIIVFVSAAAAEENQDHPSDAAIKSILYRRADSVVLVGKIRTDTPPPCVHAYSSVVAHGNDAWNKLMMRRWRDMPVSDLFGIGSPGMNSSSVEPDRCRLKNSKLIIFGSLSEQTNERTNEQTNERTNEQTNEQTKERTNERKNEQTNERTDERTNEQTNEHTNEKNERTNERMNEQTNERTNVRTNERTNVKPHAF